MRLLPSMPSLRPQRLGRSLRFGALALTAATGLLVSDLAAAGTQATSSLDWTTFSAAAAPGSFAWVDGSAATYVHVYSPHNFDFSTDWTTDLSTSLSNGGSTAMATVTGGGNKLEASAGSGGGSLLANVNRYASFTLAAGATVTFTVQGWLTQAGDANPGATANTELQVFDATDTDKLAENRQSLSFIGGTGVTNTLSFTNTSGSDATYMFFANANAGVVSTVPEPASAALALGGLAFLALGATSRRRTVGRVRNKG